MIAFKIKKLKFAALTLSAFLALSCDKNEKNDDVTPEVKGADGVAVRTSNILHSTKAKDKKSASLAIYDKTTVGIKNFDQINVSMSKVTGLTKDSVAGVFANVKNSLPSQNNYSLFTGSMQVSVVKLASEYCHLSFNDNTLRNNILGDLQGLYNQKISDALTPENQAAIMAQFASKFWIHSSNYAKGVDANRVITEMFAELVEGRADTQAETRKILRATCVLYLSASPVIIL